MLSPRKGGHGVRHSGRIDESGSAKGDFDDRGGPVSDYDETMRLSLPGEFAIGTYTGLTRIIAGLAAVPGKHADGFAGREPPG